MKLKLLDALDTVLHKVLDPIINFEAFGRWHVPGWSYLQVWQYHICVAYENEYDRQEGR